MRDMILYLTLCIFCFHLSNSTRTYNANTGKLYQVHTK